MASLPSLKFISPHYPLTLSFLDHALVLAPKYDIDFAAPKGPNPPVDPASITGFKYASAKKLSEVNSNDYDAVFYVGGFGPVLDLASDPLNLLGASHYPLTLSFLNPPLVLAPKADLGFHDDVAKKFTKVIFNDYAVFYVGGFGPVLYLASDPANVKLANEEVGAVYEKAAEPFGVHVVVDGELINGQNSASAGPIGEAIDKALSA
ncbi:hypothetical protein C8Q80DRAFT_1119299 [Daedaleopsis nitida]|nr:hypothetical protein C8Q80DRAFT_1119299 [Daedaleopsis nitida]